MMKVLQFVLPLLIIVNCIETSKADDGTETIVMKRPFCNAFTGCGKKRDPNYATGYPVNQLPYPLYRVLKHFANVAAAEARMKRLGYYELPEQQQQQQQIPLQQLPDQVAFPPGPMGY